LLAAIAATGLADLAARLTAPAAGRPPAQLVELGRRYLAFAAERPAIFELTFRHDLLEGAVGNFRATKTLDLILEDSQLDAFVVRAVDAHLS
jgi:hypothetical protein